MQTLDERIAGQLAPELGHQWRVEGFGLVQQERKIPDMLRQVIPAKILLHIGTMKTGSTAIQNGFDKNHSFLLAHRVLFPRSILNRTHPEYPRRTSGHLRFLRHWREEDSQAFAAELQATRGAADLLFLSVENIFHGFDGNALEALRCFLGDANVTLLCFLRPQLEWSASLYHELVTKGRRRETAGYPEFVETLLAEGKLDYHSRLKAISEVLGARSVIAVDYDEAKKTGGAVDVALQAVGISGPMPEAVTPGDGNPSQSFPEAIEAHRRLNVLAGALSDAEYFSWCAGMEGVAAKLRLEQDIPVAHVEAEPALRQRVFDACEDSNRRLSAEFLGGAPFGAASTARGRENAAPLNEAVVGDLIVQGTDLLSPYFTASAPVWQKRRRALKRFSRKLDERDGRIAGLEVEAEALRESLCQAERKQQEAAAGLMRREAENSANRASLKAQARQLAMLQSSMSWRLTAPLRTFKKSAALLGRRLKKAMFQVGRRA